MRVSPCDKNVVADSELFLPPLGTSWPMKYRQVETLGTSKEASKVGSNAPQILTRI